MRRFFLVELNVSDDRKTAIKTGYRPDWVGDFKPEYNCAQVLFPTDLPEIGPGNFHRGVLLEPLRPELWDSVREGQMMWCKEGLKTVGHAIVLKVFE